MILVAWGCDFGRMGSLDGLFITTQETLDRNMGRTAYFGEALGKHSEVQVTLDKDQFRVLSTDIEKIEWLRALVTDDTISGENPLMYIQCVQCCGSYDELNEDGLCEYCVDENNEYEDEDNE